MGTPKDKRFRQCCGAHPRIKQYYAKTVWSCSYWDPDPHPNCAIEKLQQHDPVALEAELAKNGKSVSEYEKQIEEEWEALGEYIGCAANGKDNSACCRGDTRLP